jgi:hypothetical protein
VYVVNVSVRIIRDGSTRKKGSVRERKGRKAFFLGRQLYPLLNRSDPCDANVEK